MKNFTYSIPTIIHFGKGQIEHLGELKEDGDRVLMVYGGGSIKRTGVYDDAVDVLKKSDVEIFELPGVEPNPRVQLVRKGIEICRENDIGMVLAIGGGSTIDCAKLIAAGVCYDGDPWELMEDSSLIKSAIPVYCVLTLAATGSEMDDSTVISDPEINRKLDISSKYIKPKMSVLDPSYTFSVSAEQTAAGAADIMSHVFESYFTNVEGAAVQAHFCESILKTVIKYAPLAIKNPDDYEARANLMWCSTLALNGILTYGAKVKWCVHPVEHELSAYYDITHGVGLAILTPVWMEYVLSENTAPKFAEYGRNVWNLPYESDDLETAKQAIECTRSFFRELGLPQHLNEIGIDDEYFEKMAQGCVEFCDGCYVPLKAEDIINIYNNAI